MASRDLDKTQAALEENFAAFEKQYPDVTEAMKIMNISFHDYLQALAAMREVPSMAGNATTNP
jgi:hypothetical protein